MSAFLDALLAPAYPKKGTKVGPEDKDCIQFANWMKEKIKKRELSCLFFHVPNEGKRHWIQGQLQKAKGLISGVPDFVIMYEQGSMLIEFKAKKGRQTTNQKHFERWAKREGIPYHLVWSADEAIDLIENTAILWASEKDID